MTMPWRSLLLCLAPLVLVAQDIEAVRKEPNLARRSQRALEFADREMAKAQRIVRDFGSRTELQAALDSVVAGSELALQALRETGRPPRRLSREYKRGELKTRDLIRRLEDLGKALSLDDRSMAEGALKQVNGIHEDFLLGVMGQKRP
jgi:hypothetical protein